MMVKFYSRKHTKNLAFLITRTSTYVTTTSVADYHLKPSPTFDLHFFNLKIQKKQEKSNHQNKKTRKIQYPDEKNDKN